VIVLTGTAAVVFLIICGVVLFLKFAGGAKNASKDRKRRAQRDQVWQRRGGSR
jgi:hypothetical protein